MKTSTCILLLSTVAFALERNPYFKSDEDLQKWFWDSTASCDRTLLSVAPVDSAVWKIESFRWIKQICGEDDFTIGLHYNIQADSLMCGYGYIAGIHFPEDSCASVKMTSNQLSRIKIISRYFIAQEAGRRLRQMHTAATVLYKSNQYKKAADAAMGSVDNRYWKLVPITSANVTIYNDLGFFLELGGKDKESIILLSEVIRAAPDRVVAYLNLADAKWKTQNIVEAKELYCTYIEKMKSMNLEKKIPSRAINRCSSNE